MRLIAKVIRISHAKFHCNRLTAAVQDIQDYASLIVGTHCSYKEVLIGTIGSTQGCRSNDG